LLSLKLQCPRKIIVVAAVCFVVVKHTINSDGLNLAAMVNRRNDQRCVALSAKNGWGRVGRGVENPLEYWVHGVPLGRKKAHSKRAGCWCAERDSNPHLTAYEADALPLSYLRRSDG
jgi:hypothetical protein